MYLRYAAAGGIAFALSGALLGYVWVAADFPFAMGLQWAVGGAVLGWIAGGHRMASRQALVGGVTYLVALFGLLFVSLGVYELPAPLAVAAVIAALAVGAALGGTSAAWRVGLAALVGFALGQLALYGVSALQPETAGDPGVVQYTWFAAGQAVFGLLGGAGVGVGFAWSETARPSDPAAP